MAQNKLSVTSELKTKILSFLKKCKKNGFPPELVCHFINEPESKVYDAIQALKKAGLIYQTGEATTALVISSEFPKETKKIWSFTPPYQPKLTPIHLPNRVF